MTLQFFRDWYDKLYFKIVEKLSLFYFSILVWANLSTPIISNKKKHKDCQTLHIIIIIKSAILISLFMFIQNENIILQTYEGCSKKYSMGLIAALTNGFQ